VDSIVPTCYTQCENRDEYFVALISRYYFSICNLMCAQVQALIEVIQKEEQSEQKKEEASKGDL